MTTAAPTSLCKARSAMTDTGLYRCTLPEGHDGPHKSAVATWYDDTGFAAFSYLSPALRAIALTVFGLMFVGLTGLTVFCLYMAVAV